jgi:hypothetical protein
MARRRDHSSRHRQGLRAPDALEHAVLEYAKELRLQRAVEVADLVQEDRPRARSLEPTAAQRSRARERVLLVAEELALDQGGRERGAIDVDEWFRAARRELVHDSGDESLSCPGLSLQQNLRVDAGGLVHFPTKSLHRGALADQ